MEQETSIRRWRAPVGASTIIVGAPPLSFIISTLPSVRVRSVA